MPPLQRLRQGSAYRSRGIVDQDVDPAKTLLDGGDQLINSIKVGQVADERLSQTASLGDAMDEHVQSVLTASYRDNRGAAAGEHLSGTLTDA
jgi:hypothetical protein